MKGGDNCWYSLAPPLCMQEPDNREDRPGEIKWIKDYFAAINFKKQLMCVIVVPVSLNCFWAGQLQACVFPGFNFLSFLLVKHSTSGKAIPVRWGVMAFSCLFTHMNNTYSENHGAVNTCKCYQLEIFKVQKLMNVQLEEEGHDKSKLEAETWVQPSPLQKEAGMLEDPCSFGNIS